MTRFIFDKNWNELGEEFVSKGYKESSSKALVSDVNRIVGFFIHLKNEYAETKIDHITLDKIIENINYHITKTNNPLRSENSIYRYIGTFSKFFEFLQYDKGFVGSHVFHESIPDLKKFKNHFKTRHNLDERKSKDPYDLNEILRVIMGIDKRLRYATKDQLYRYLQQSIYIQLTLLSGAKMNTIGDLKRRNVDNGSVEINGISIRLPSYSKIYMDKYLTLRKGDNDDLFTKPNGDKYSAIASLFSTGFNLINVCVDVGLLDPDINVLSNNSLRATALREFVNEDVLTYPILVLSGLKPTNNFLDKIYISNYENENRVREALNNNSNSAIGKLYCYKYLDVCL